MGSQYPKMKALTCSSFKAIDELDEQSEIAPHDGTL